MNCLPCTLLHVDPTTLAPVVGLCPSCQGALCLAHWDEQQHASGPGGMRLGCDHTGDRAGDRGDHRPDQVSGSAARPAAAVSR